MRKILITGKDSYIGMSFASTLSIDKDKYIVDSIDMKKDNWKDFDFSYYDVVFHVAGIAHVSSDPKKEYLYRKVNTELTIETAKKAKKEGVSQFIFMSSIIVYGENGKKDSVITRDTIPIPNNFYGESKLEAEQGLNDLHDEKFKVAILRPPMVYGKGSKGNYHKLSSFAKKTHVFPKYQNERSMLYIENLIEFIKNIVDSNRSGVFFPQNKDYVCTSELVKTIANINNHRILFTTFLNPLISLGIKHRFIKKVFGSLVYEKSMSTYDFDYQMVSFEDSVKITEMI